MERLTEVGLYIVPTPIGNLQDMTLRALDVLRDCDLICCEDTRHTGKLLQYFEIQKPVLSYHEHNEHERAVEIVDRVIAGECIAVVSDAGMPGISDPGAVVIREAIARDVPYTVLPGASASITAVVASGLDVERFQFVGFLPMKQTDRETLLAELDEAKQTSILYEAPHRIERTLSELTKRWPERLFSVSRELTKIYEETLHFQGAAYDATSLTAKGEFVIVVGPAETLAPTEAYAEEDIAERLQELRAEGLSNKDAVRAVCDETGWTRNDVYRISVEAK